MITMSRYDLSHVAPRHRSRGPGVKNTEVCNSGDLDSDVLPRFISSASIVASALHHARASVTAQDGMLDAAK